VIVIENECAEEKISACYRPIIVEAIRAYQEIFAETVSNIRLMGSVARGEAILNQSDIDFMVILKFAPSREQQEQLRNRAANLLGAHPVVSKIDLDCLFIDDISEFQKFVFCSDSISLWGQDRFREAPLKIDAKHLAALVTPDLKSLVPSYISSVEVADPNDRSKLMQWSRWCGKDVIKCLRGEAIVREEVYCRSILASHRQLQRCFPQHVELVDALLELYTNPKSQKEEILEIMVKARETLYTLVQHEQ
jgi:predicted nucleotidyltransferase